MSILYGDFGWGSVIPADFKLDNLSGVGRYSSSDASKCLGVVEAQKYIDAGLGIELFAENGAACIGAPAGEQMGRVALAHMMRVGAPIGMCNFLAEDYDSQPGDWGGVAAALDAFRNVLHHAGYLGGFYGKLSLGEAMCRDGHVDQTAASNFLFHQTEAWSGHAISSMASVYQRAQQVNVDGTSIDIDVLLADNIGQWPSPSAPPKGNVVKPEYSPALRPITCSTLVPGGGVLAIADDGSSYYINVAPGTPEHTGMNVDTKDWGTRVAAQVEVDPTKTNLPFTIKDSAGEFYDRGYLPGQSPLRW